MTQRQIQILIAIVEQYAEVASPVGSNLLAKLFNVSSATVRADMVELEKLGLIAQPHTSAGRVPTDRGYRYYVNYVNETANLSNPLSNYERRAERAITARVIGGGLPQQTIRNAVDTMAELTRNLGFATIGDQLYMSGLSNLLGQPEFIHTDSVQQVARFLDNLEPWLIETAPNEPISVYIGAENPIGRSAGCSLIISQFRSPYSDRSYVGILGPTRQSYRDVISLVKRTGELLEGALYE
ncbi:MAG TPA: DeoR family transcriptional regulator [Candidatus Dormibacteraeota bacterium]|nr:DeoR family transcriptional regulator [Candidatus Dormibacteraeota bacterium]